MTMSEQFEVGQKVAVVCRIGSVPTMHRVQRVLKRFIELDDDSRWTHYGSPYPRRDWPGQHLTAWTEQHTRQCQIAHALTVARNLVERLREQEVREARQLVDELKELLQKVEAK